MQRDVVKWIQSLELSYPIHNPRRDLANGFTVAQILSRYDKEISMHSFDTGSSINRRFDNWQQIQKILKRLRCTTITDDMVQNTLQSRDGAAIALIEALYCFLTKKTLKPNVVVELRQEPEAELPAFMKGTASQVLRNANDPTQERFAKLTGKTDEVRLKNANEAALETHKVKVQAAKFEDPDRYQFKSVTAEEKQKMAEREARALKRGGGSSPTGGGSPGSTVGTTTNKVRQKLQVARQMAVRTVDEHILHAFASRQEHEREESFKAQFDADEDLSRALSRVVVRPLQQLAMAEQMDEYAAAHGGLGASADGGLDYFNKFIAQRHVLPIEVKSRVWASLDEVSNNIAKHLNLRRDECHHLIIGLDFLWRRDVAMKKPTQQSVAQPESYQMDIDAALDLLCKVGAAWAQMDAEASLSCLTNIIGPSIADALEYAVPAMLARYMDVVASFCNMRDIEACKTVLQSLDATLSAGRFGGGNGGSAATSPRGALVASLLLSHVDVEMCLGADEVIDYYIAAFLSQSSPAHRIAALQLVRFLGRHAVTLQRGGGGGGGDSSGGGSSSAATVAAEKRAKSYVPRIVPLLADSDWEVRMVLLQALCTMLPLASPSFPNADSETPTSFDNGASGNSGTDNNKAASSAAVITDSLLRAFDSLGQCSAIVQQASLCAVAPALDEATLPELTHRFLRRLLCGDLPMPQAVRTMDPNASNVDAAAGRASGLFAAGALSKLWNPTAVASALVDLRSELSSYQVLAVLDPLVQLAGDCADAPDFWTNVAAHLRSDVVDAVQNPAALRLQGTQGDSSAVLAACAELASGVAMKLYGELAGENDEELEDLIHGAEGDEAADAWTRLRDRSIEWVGML